MLFNPLFRSIPCFRSFLVRYESPLRPLASTFIRVWAVACAASSIVLYSNPRGGTAIYWSYRYVPL